MLCRNISFVSLLQLNENENEIDRLLKEVATLRWGVFFFHLFPSPSPSLSCSLPSSSLSSSFLLLLPPPFSHCSITPKFVSISFCDCRRAGIGGKSVFELKQNCEEEYSPFFYHYNRTDQSKVYD